MEKRTNESIVMIGQTVSHFKIHEKLAEGGRGDVYKAHDTKLDRLVALKFLPQQITVIDEDKARFLQEARPASAVMHPNVCVIYDIAEHDKQQFIVEEENLLLTHIRRHAIESEETQVAELGGIVAVGSSVATACYTDRDPVFHIMDGSF